MKTFMLHFDLNTAYLLKLVGNLDDLSAMQTHKSIQTLLLLMVQHKTKQFKADHLSFFITYIINHFGNQIYRQLLGQIVEAFLANGLAREVLCHVLDQDKVRSLEISNCLDIIILVLDTEQDKAFFDKKVIMLLNNLQNSSQNQLRLKERLANLNEVMKSKYSQEIKQIYESNQENIKINNYLE